LWDQALEAMDKQDYASACPKLEEVARLGPEGLDAKLKLAECYEGSGRLASAWTMYALVEPLAEKANQSDRQKAAHDRAEALKPRLATLTIIVPATVRARPGLEIRCDDRVVEPAQWGVPLPVDRGRHVIVATATVRGEQPEVIEADGATKTVTIVQPASVTPPSAVTPPVSAKRSVAPAVVLGLLAGGDRHRDRIHGGGVLEGCGGRRCGSGADGSLRNLRDQVGQLRHKGVRRSQAEAR
jgi:hypothetical protein